MTKAFNLLDMPWLPVRMQSGEIRDLGLLELFAQADKIRALAETAPPSLIAQYRLLLAITHRALSGVLPQWRERDQVKWFQHGLPVQEICTYLEQWRERFWLFHPEYPFMQVAELASATETADRCKPWTQIELASVSGNAPVVFNHSLDNAPTTITPAEAIRSLLGFLQFTPGGLVKVFRDADKAGPLANTAAAIPLGDSLAKTLVLGLHSASPQHQDLPCWERAPLTIVDLRAAPTLATGPNDRYTRQTRAVLLLPEENSEIRQLRFAAGQALEEDPQAPDPMASYRAGSNGLVRLTFTEGRALWRDLPALLPDGGTRGSSPAAILGWVINLNKELKLSTIPLLVAGLASDQAKLLRWRSEQLVLPKAIFEQPESTRTACEMLEKAEILFADLRGAGVVLIAETLPDSQQKDTRSRARALFDVSPAPSLYFACAERTLMKALALSEHDPDKAESEWQSALKQAALGAWEALLASQGGSASIWRANAKAERRLGAAIKKHLYALDETGVNQ